MSDFETSTTKGYLSQFVLLKILSIRITPQYLTIEAVCNMCLLMVYWKIHSVSENSESLCSDFSPHGIFHQQLQLYVCTAQNNKTETYSTFLAHSGGLLRVMKPQLVRMVSIIKMLNIVEGKVKEHIAAVTSKKNTLPFIYNSRYLQLFSRNIPWCSWPDRF